MKDKTPVYIESIMAPSYQVRKDVGGEKVVGVEWKECLGDKVTCWLFNFGDQGRFSIEKTTSSSGSDETSDLLVYRQKEGEIETLLNVSSTGERGRVGIETIREFDSVLRKKADAFFALGVADDDMNTIAKGLFKRIKQSNESKAIIDLFFKTYEEPGVRTYF